MSATLPYLQRSWGTGTQSDVARSCLPQNPAHSLTLSLCLSVSHLFAALDPLGPATLGLGMFRPYNSQVFVLPVHLVVLRSGGSGCHGHPPKLLEPGALGLGGMKEEMEKDKGHRTKLERWQLG